MAITQAMSTSFKVEILDGIHNFGTGVVRASTAADTFKIALYTSSASLDAATTVYSSTNEVTSTNYTAGGIALSVSVVPTSSGTTAYLSFTSPVTWSSVTFTTLGALIYNSTQGNKAVAVLSFGTAQTVSGGDFNVIFPTASSTTAILRIE
jgi:hypothetical protein